MMFVVAMIAAAPNGAGKWVGAKVVSIMGVIHQAAHRRRRRRRRR